MDGERKIWLVNNASSGSNDDTALAALDKCCGDNGFRVAHRTVFPAQDLPTPAILDAASIDTVVAFAGDGTVNTLIAALAGWSGSVLVLAGGTMNLLYHRLHGDRTLDEVVAAVAAGETTMRRPGMIRSVHGDAYAGLLAGPGSSWGRVREAMRDAKVVELAQSTVQAIEQTLTGEMIACVEPALGRPEGYPLIMLTPHDAGIEVEAYYAEGASQYLEQAWALLKRNFREGPHEVLGHAQAVRLASTEGNPFGVLVDGEQADAAPEVEFKLAKCEVDLLATEANGEL
jgi:diacylglycerol kinase family enzyme